MEMGEKFRIISARKS